MKLISGSILLGLSLIALVFGHLRIGTSLISARARPDWVVRLDEPVEALIIMVMIAGIGLMVWGIIEQRKDTRG